VAHWITAGIAALIGMVAQAQVYLEPEIAIGNGGIGTVSPFVSNKETAIAVRSTNANEVALAWNHYTSTGGTLYFSVSVDGTSFTGGAALPGAGSLPPEDACGLSSPGTVDPLAAASLDGQLFLGGQESMEPFRVFVNRIAPSNGLPEGALKGTSECPSRDKPWMTIGPRRADSQQTMYITVNHPQAQPYMGQHNIRCLDTSPLGQAWPAQENPIRPCVGCSLASGLATAGAVLTASDPSLHGRLFVSYGASAGRPASAYSDGQGVDGSWQGFQAIPPTIPAHYNGGGFLGELSGGESRPGVRPRAFPSVAVSPDGASSSEKSGSVPAPGTWTRTPSWIPLTSLCSPRRTSPARHRQT
jgi:hypothetical protein